LHPGGLSRVGGELAGADLVQAAITTFAPDVCWLIVLPSTM
jgi:hypothetical protein